jgi:ATP-dependent Lhr-like helicase
VAGAEGGAPSPSRLRASRFGGPLPLPLRGRGALESGITPLPDPPPQGARGKLVDEGRGKEVDGGRGTEFLTGAAAREARLSSSVSCRVIDSGHRRARDLGLELPPAPLEAVMSGEVWKLVHKRLAELIQEHRTTLIFVNTRRMAERVTRALSDLVGSSEVAAHHGSLAKEQRLDAEQRLKGGKLRALVATASLELGIDIGDVDLVCQLGSPRSIASFLQRVGRSGHAVTGTPKGRLFPLSRDELVEGAALLDSVRRGELDLLKVPENALDVLAQQIVAEAASRDCGEDELYDLFRRAWPYRDLTREDYAAVVAMLAEGYAGRRGRRGALLHHDAVNHRLRGRRGARLTAITSGGTIPDTADYQVLLEPENQFIGTVNEDFAVESLAGDVFQLGNAAYRILRVERGTVRVEDAKGAPPNIPFWLGEAPGRSDELSVAVSRLRAEASARLRLDPSGESLRLFFEREMELGEAAARQLADYLAAGHAALGELPTQETIILERFFDEAGGMQLVLHSPYGSRLNRAWGLALRKRFCRKFNFELQAAATEDNIVLSLTTAHSFDLDEVPRYLHAATVRPLLIQAVLDAPMFGTRWRWVAGVSLALPRFRGGKKVPPQLQRMNAEDLVASIFPDQLACGENIVGEREIPDHPLVRQTLEDCLEEAMDIEGLERLLKRIEAGEIETVARDLTEPSPLAVEVLSARPYAYLDDAPLEERRTQAVMSRRWLAPEEAAELGKLDAEAIERVRGEAWPEAVNEDELHDALVWLGFLTAAEAAARPGWGEFLRTLAREKRATAVVLPGSQPESALPAKAGIQEPQTASAEARPLGPRFRGDDEKDHETEPSRLWVAAERLPYVEALWPAARLEPAIAAPEGAAVPEAAETALVELLRGRLEGLGPVTESDLAAPLGVARSEVAAALAALQAEGFAMRGRFSPGAEADEWCERRLLARIHRYTVKRLRAEIEPVAARDFLRFLLRWQKLESETRMEGPDALEAVIAQLEGFEAPAGAWETEILPARLKRYEPGWLDDLCLAGRVAWARLKPRNPRLDSERGKMPVRTTPVTLLARRHLALWAALSPAPDAAPASAAAESVLALIRERGASFFDEIADGSGLLKPQVEDALAELVALGLVAADSFAGLRALLLPAEKRRQMLERRRRPMGFGMEDAGRWALARRARPQPVAAETAQEAVEHLARTLLRRYGVVFWRLLEREADWLPPWRDLLRVYRRLEARGDIRGGRFVAGFAGEQFALPEAVGLLREVRKRPETGALLSLSGADPLNLAGVLTPGPKLAALTGNRLLYRDGLPIAFFAGGKVQYLEELDAGSEWAARRALIRGATPRMLVGLR